MLSNLTCPFLGNENILTCRMLEKCLPEAFIKTYPWGCGDGSFRKYLPPSMNTSTNIKSQGRALQLKPRTGEAETRTLGIASLLGRLPCSKFSDKILALKGKMGPASGLSWQRHLAADLMALTLDSDPRGPTWKTEQTQYTLFSDLQSYTVAYTCMDAHTHTCINKHRKVESNYEDIKTDLWCLQLSVHMNIYIHMQHIHNQAPS